MEKKRTIRVHLVNQFRYVANWRKIICMGHGSCGNCIVVAAEIVNLWESMVGGFIINGLNSC